MTAVDTGLAAEYAAIFAYGAAAVHLEGEPRERAQALDAEHRSRRDLLLDFFGANGVDPTPPEAAYDVGSVPDAETARQVLTRIEQDVTSTWRAGTAAEDPDEQRMCLEMYKASAAGLAQWRLAIGEDVAEPWPGRPE